MKKKFTTVFISLLLSIIFVNISRAAVTVTLITSAANGITSPFTITDGQSSTVVLGFQVQVTGSATSTIPNLYVNSTLTTLSTFFPSATLIQKSSNNYTTGTTLNTYPSNSSGALYKFNVNRSYPTGIYYYFVVLNQAKFTTNAAPGSITFNATASTFFNNSPSVTVSGTGTTYKTYGFMYWTGDNSSSWTTSGAWSVSDYNGGKSAANRIPTSTDIVNIGVLSYSSNGGANPTISSSTTVQAINFGSFKTTSTNSPASIAINGSAVTLTVNGDVTVNSNGSGGISGTGSLLISGDFTNSGTATLSNTGNVSFAGDFTNNISATVTTTTNTVNFNGSSDQTISNCNTSASSTVSFNNVIFSGNNTKTFTSDGCSSVASTGKLTLLGSSTIVSIPTTTTHLQLLASISNPLEYAQIETIPSGCTIKGNIDYQVYFQGNNNLSYRNYRSMGVPVYNNTTSYSSNNGSYKLADLKNSFIITGAGGTTNGFDASTNNGATLRKYNPSTDDYTYITSLNSNPTISTGTGFYMYFRGDRINTPGTVTAADPFGSKTNKANGGGSYAAPESVMFNYTGIPNQGDINTVTVTNGNTNNFYFLANPYAATLNASSLIATTQYSYWGIIGYFFGIPIPGYISDNWIAAKTWTWSPTAGGYAVYDDETPSASTNNAKKYIVPGQGFFIKANNSYSGSSKTLTITESMKATGNSSSAVRLLSTSAPAQTSELPITRLQFYKNENINDEIAIVLKPAAKDSLDASDATHMNGDYMNFTTITPDNNYLAVDKRPFKGPKTIIPLFINIAADSIYTFKKTYTNAAMANYKVTLYDSLLNNSIDITHIDYKFNVTRANAATYGGKRFKLIIEASPALVTYFDFGGKLTENKKGLLTWQTNKYHEGTTYQLQRSQDNVTFTDVSTPRTGVEGTPKNTFELLDNDIQTGVNYYRLVQKDVFNNTSISNTVMLNVNTNIGPIDIKNGFKLYPNPVTTTLSIISDKTYGKVNMRIYNAMSEVKATKTYAQLNALEPIQDNVSQLKPGVYLVELRDANNKVLTTLKFLKQ